MRTTTGSRAGRDGEAGDPPPYSPEWLTGLPDQRLQELHRGVERALFEEYTLDAASYDPDEVWDQPNRRLEELERRYGFLDEEVRRRSPGLTSGEPAVGPEPASGPAQLAEPAVMRDWLASPATGTTKQSVADLLKIDNTFGQDTGPVRDRHGKLLPTAEFRVEQLADLVRTAQEAGLLHVPNHRINLQKALENRDLYLIIIDRPGGARLVSGPHHHDLATPADSPIVTPHGIDAAVEALQRVATHVNSAVRPYTNAENLRAGPVHGSHPQAPGITAASFAVPPSTAVSQPNAAATNNMDYPHQRTSTTAHRRLR